MVSKVNEITEIAVKTLFEVRKEVDGETCVDCFGSES